MAVIGLDVAIVVSAGTSADVLVALVIDVILFVRVLGFAMVGLT